MGVTWNIVQSILLLTLQAHYTASDGHGSSTPCLRPYGDHLEGCLEAIREIAQDNERFFFGTSYVGHCSPPEMWYHMDCYNRFPYRNNSIISALFHPGTFDPDTIDRYLHVNFTSPAGEYHGCDHHYKQEEDIKFALDPSSEETHLPWHVRNPPLVMWEEDPDKQYTLVAQDVGYGYLHALYINIPGSMIEEGQAIKEYHGPMNIKKEVNPYVVMVFEQTVKDVTLSAEWSQIIYANDGIGSAFNISDFVKQTSMTGPIAMNWILASFDAYAVEMQKTWGIDNCGGLIEQEIVHNHAERPFFEDDLSLRLNTRIEVHSEQLSFTYCCLHTYEAKDFFLDPIGNEVVDPALVRTDNHLHTHITIRTLYHIPNALNGHYFTMILIDPDVPYNHVATEEKPLVHWMIVNAMVKDDMLVGGEELLTYRGPLPPDDKPHTYYFLIYDHFEDEITDTDLGPYSDPDCSVEAGRCLFDINLYQKNHRLTLAGASWFRSENNEFVQMMREVPKDEACRDKKCVSVSRAAGVTPLSGLMALLCGAGVAAPLGFSWI